MGMGCINGPMAVFTRVIGIKIGSLSMESIIGMMAEHIRAIG